MKTVLTSIGDDKIKAIYINSFTPEKNLVLFLLQQSHRSSIILQPNFDLIKWVKYFEIESNVSINGDLIAFSMKHELFARTKINLKK
jgi:hypothetical protein